MRLKAGSVIFSIYLSIIIFGIISLLFIQLTFSTNQITDIEIDNRLNSNINSCIALLESGVKIIDSSGKLDIDLFSDFEDSVKVKKETWGVYDLIKITSKYKNREINHYGLFGIKVRNVKYALIINDKTDLFLLGYSKITGDVLLKSGRCYKGDIQNLRSFSKTVVNQSDKINIDSLMLKQYNLANKIKEMNYSYFSLIGLANNYPILNKNSVINSFSNEYQVFRTKNGIISQTLNGKIIIVSDRTIKIRSSAKLENIIIVAPRVQIEKGFIGNIQIFCRDSLLIGSNVKLKYPSSICLNNNSGKGLVSLDSNTSVLGSVYLLGSEFHRLRISPKSFIKGFVRNDGYVILEGDIIGQLICKGFSLLFENRLYQNYILNGRININELPELFVKDNLSSYSESNISMIKKLE